MSAETAGPSGGPPQPAGQPPGCQLLDLWPECLEGVELCSPCLRVASFAYRGRGLVATECVRAGAALVREAPQVTAGETDHEALALMADAVAARSGAPGRFDRLCTLAEDGFAPDSEHNTHHHQSEECKGAVEKARSQVKANGFAAKSNGGTVSLSLFSVVSFCNHSCLPNAALSLPDPHSLASARTLYAIRDIAAGQEVLICYDSKLLWLPEVARRRHTTATWGFVCSCGKCSPEAVAGDTDSFTGIERYFDADAQLTSGVILHPEPERDDQPGVVDIYEEAKDFYGAVHWRTHVAREASLRAMLDKAPEAFDFDMLIEHMDALAELSAVIHPHYLTWYSRMEQVVASDSEGINEEVEWSEWIQRTRDRTFLYPEVLGWNGIQHVR